MNNINFSGIQNLKIAKKEYPYIGTYLGLDNTIKQGEKHITEIKISAQLTDDKFGKDLSDFKKRLPDNNFLNPIASDKIELHVKRTDIPDEFMNQSSFILNGKPLAVDSNNKMPIMTFLARLTRQSAEKPEISNNQKKYLDLANKSIHKETVDFIENKV